MGSPDCSSIRLKLPPLAPPGAGPCEGADAILVQVRAGSRSYWEKAEALAPPDAPAAAERELTVRADPAMVYQFRALARNAAGISAPGGASPPTMVNRFHAALLEPPSPVATSSASYVVSWGATATLGACQPDVRWELLYSRVADGEWHRVAHNLAAESVEVPALRCAQGCVFKARVRAVEGFDGYSRNSAPLPTKALPRPRAGAVRLELRLGSTAPPSDRPEERPEGSPSAEGGPAPSDAALARGLATLAGLPAESVSIVERRCGLDGGAITREQGLDDGGVISREREADDGACFVVFDLCLQSADAARAMAAARDLARSLQGRDARGGGAGLAALRGVDLQYGLRLVSQDSDATPRVEPAFSLRAALLAALRSLGGGLARPAPLTPSLTLILILTLALTLALILILTLALTLALPLTPNQAGPALPHGSAGHGRARRDRRAARRPRHSLLRLLLLPPLRRARQVAPPSRQGTPGGGRGGGGGGVAG